MSAALASAFEAAGYRDPRQQLRDIATSCVEQFTTIDDARAEFLRRALADPALAYELFKPWLKVAADDYLSSAARKAAERRREEGHRSTVEKANAAFPPRANSLPSNIVPVREHLRGKAGTVAPQPLSTMARIAASAAREPEVRNYLHSFTINGRPIGEVTGMEARAWVRSHRRDTRFVALLAEGVPDMSAIGAHRTVEEAAAIYAQAEQEAQS